MSTEKNAYLDAVLKTHNIELEVPKMNAYRTERDRIKVALEARYRGQIYGPLNSGSCAKATAINTNFDLDLAIPFKKTQFGTLKEMFEDVETFMDQLKRQPAFPITRVSRQRRSINLALNVNGEELDIDIVPGRELQIGKYEIDYNLNLYDSKAETWIQTNIKAHNELLKKRPLERDVVKLLKAWKAAHKAEMKSFFVELMILEAFKDPKRSLAGKKLYERLHGSLDFMAENITTIPLIDPANSANVVSETLTLSEKMAFREQFKTMLTEIEASKAKLMEYFPLNPAHHKVVDPDLLAKFKPYPRSSGINSYA